MLLYACLFFSGATSLMYELLWSRIFSFSFGGTSLAFAVVLAVFFLGLAGGSWFGGRFAPHLKRPFLAYGFLELGIGIYAAAVFPFLFHLQALFAWVNASGTESAGVLFRFAVSALVLALPTLGMGATFPVLLEHLHREGSPLFRSVGNLYGVNTLGAFFGVYLATHWSIPLWGLDGAYYAAVALNAAVFILVFTGARKAQVRVSASAPAAMAPGEGGPAFRSVGLMFVAVSGFATLGYEIVWSRVLTIVMEGSIYGIGATLGSFLLGIGLGGLVFSWAGPRLSDPHLLFRVYVAVCLAITAYLAASRWLLPVEGYLIHAVTTSLRSLAGLHANFALAALFLLPITAGLGFLFPCALALFNQGRTSPTQGTGTAYALNTACGVAGSLLTAAFLMDRLGLEGVVWVNVLLLLGSLLLGVLRVENGRRARWALAGPVLLALLFAAGWWPAMDAKTVLVNAYDGKPPSLSGMFRSLAGHFGDVKPPLVYKDGVGATVTVDLQGRTYSLRSNGLPQSGRSLDPPHYNMESSLVGLFPVLHRPDAENALVIGLGAGITVGVLRKAGIPRVEVVEIEPAMPAICRNLYPKGQSPLDDSAVSLHVDDARNFLVRNLRSRTPKRWRLIASQPAHPWVSGAADLFTREMFRLVYRSLDSGGVFGQWFMPSGIDDRAFQSILNAFGSVFDRVAIYRTTGGMDGFYFVGAQGDARLDPAAIEALFQRPGLRSLLALNAHTHPADLLRYNLVPLLPGRLLVEKSPVNTDRNAFIETRMPLLSKSAQADSRRWNSGLFTGPSPALFRAAGAAESLMVYEALDRLAVFAHAKAGNSSDTAESERLALIARNHSAPWNSYARIHLGIAAKKLGPEELSDSIARSSGSRKGALLRTYARAFSLAPMPPFPPEARDWPESFAADLKGAYALALADQGRFEPAFSALKQAPHAPRTDSALVAVMAETRNAGDGARRPGFRLDSALFDSIFARTLDRYARRPGRMKAVESYCLAAGFPGRAEFLRSFGLQKRDQEIQDLMLGAEALKKGKAWDKAAAAYEKALERNSANLQAYLGLAEIFGAQRRERAFHALLGRVRSVFPLNEVARYRVEEVFSLASALAVGTPDSAGR